MFYYNQSLVSGNQWWPGQAHFATAGNYSVSLKHTHANFICTALHFINILQKIPTSNLPIIPINLLKP